MATQRATVRLLLPCNNECVFCAQAGLAAEVRDDEWFSRALDSARSQGDELTFIGGEPTLDPMLRDRVAAARAHGFRRIGIQTHGRSLSNPSYAAALSAAGLTDVHLSLHAAEPAVHDYHTGIDGSLVASLAGLAAARAQGLTVTVTTVVTRSNYRNLAPMPSLLGSRGVAGWLLQIPRVAGRAAHGFDRVIPRLALALPFALHALDAAIARGIPAWIAGAPLCMLGPFATRALPETERAYAAPCGSCAARVHCGGVDAEYLARFGDEELSAHDHDIAPAEDHGDVRVQFVGVGELVREVIVREPSTARARASLPMLGKVRPAIAEASPAADRKTGDALREILPALFPEEHRRG